MSDASNPSGNQSLGVGGIIGEAFSLTFRNFISLLLVMVLPLVVVGAVAWFMLKPLFMSLLASAGRSLEAGSADIGGSISGMLLGILVVGILAGLAFCFTYAGSVAIFFDSKSGRGASIGKAIGTGLSRMLQLFVTTIVLYILLAIVFGIVYFVAVTLLIEALSITLAVIVGIAFLILYLYVIAMFLAFIPACVVENLWISAIGRSIELTKGYRWMIVLLLILSSIVLLLLSLVIGFVIGALMPMMITPEGVSMTGIIIVGVIYLFLTVLLSGIFMGVMTLTYSRLREIKEGKSVDDLAGVFD